MAPFRLLSIAALLSVLAAPHQETQAQSTGGVSGHRHHLETYPIMALVRVYSVQYAYRVTERNELIVGLAYVNVDVQDRDGIAIGQLNAPTLPVGFRRYLWRNAHIEYQLWPAYNNYLDRVNDRRYPGFDLYNEVRTGYRLDFTVSGAALFSNLQHVYGFGLYPGNKPDSFHRAVEDAPPFHVPSISIGIRF